MTTYKGESVVFKGFGSWEVNHTLVGGPTPKSMWTTQIAVDGLFKKQDMKWRGGRGESWGMNMFIIHCINSQKNNKNIFL